jgi:hypothetical protein
VAIETLEPTITEEPAAPTSGPPGVPADDAPFVIPPGRTYIALVWSEDGATMTIRVRGIDHKAAQLATSRAALLIHDDGEARDAAAAAESPPAS